MEGAKREEKEKKSREEKGIETRRSTQRHVEKGREEIKEQKNRSNRSEVHKRK